MLPDWGFGPIIKDPVKFLSRIVWARPDLLCLLRSLAVFVPILVSIL